MKNKEKIKNFLQNCTEEQFKWASQCTSQDFNIDTITLYKYCPGELQPFKIKRIILYKDRTEVEDIVFLSEEDEKRYIFKTHELDFWRCTPEYGKYLCNKYHLNEKVHQISPTSYSHELFRNNVRVTHYIEREIISPSLWEEYKNIYKNMFIDINPAIVLEVKNDDK